MSNILTPTIAPYSVENGLVNAGYAAAIGGYVGKNYFGTDPFKSATYAAGAYVTAATVNWIAGFLGFQNVNHRPDLGKNVDNLLQSEVNEVWKSSQQRPTNRLV